MLCKSNVIEVGDYLVVVGHSALRATYRVESVRGPIKGRFVGTAIGIRKGTLAEFYAYPQQNIVRVSIPVSGANASCKHVTQFEFKLLQLSEITNV